MSDEKYFKMPLDEAKTESILQNLKEKIFKHLTIQPLQNKRP